MLLRHIRSRLRRRPIQGGQILPTATAALVKPRVTRLPRQGHSQRRCRGGRASHGHEGCHTESGLDSHTTDLPQPIFGRAVSARCVDVTGSVGVAIDSSDRVWPAGRSALLCRTTALMARLVIGPVPRRKRSAARRSAMPRPLVRVRSLLESPATGERHVTRKPRQGRSSRAIVDRFENERVALRLGGCALLLGLDVLLGGVPAADRRVQPGRDPRPETVLRLSATRDETDCGSDASHLEIPIPGFGTVAGESPGTS